MAGEVEVLLERIGLAEHTAAFAAARIGLDLLADLTDSDPKELGLSLGDRKRLLKAIAALDNPTASGLAEAPAAAIAPARPREAERR